MDGGCNYEVGDVLTVIGTATTTGFSTGTVTVANINNNIGDTVSISGVTSESYSSYNQLYRITGVSTIRELTVESRLPVTGFSTTGVGPTMVLTESYLFNNGPRLNISSLTYNRGWNWYSCYRLHSWYFQTLSRSVELKISTMVYLLQLKLLVLMNLRLTLVFRQILQQFLNSSWLSSWSVLCWNILTLYDENFGGRSYGIIVGNGTPSLFYHI